MTNTASDAELVKAYATEGSESAFRGLVARHVDLVYATALRQLGDPQTAEEVVQNVFVALARKAPRLGGIETLAGWLHRTTVLETKARIRAELRRKRRDETAAELAQIRHEGAPALDALVPLLDEALLHLRDGDRLALVLRFLEQRSLREVGSQLGVDEDAARKRVARALDRLTNFFRERGFAVGGGAATAVMTSAAQAAPATLTVSAANAGITAGGAASGLNLLLFHLMSLSKTQTAVLCALLAATPLAVQWRSAGALAREHTDASAQATRVRADVDSLEADFQSVRAARLRTQNDTLNFQARTTTAAAQRIGRAPRERYQWDDSSPVLRVPKQLLEFLPISAVNRGGVLSDQIKEVLQLTDVESGQVQAAINRFLDDYYAAQKPNLRLVPPTADDLQGRTPEETRVFELKAIGPRMNELRQALFTDLEDILGHDRFRVFRTALANWMPIDDEYHGMNSGNAIFNHDRRERFYQPQPGTRWIAWSFSSPGAFTTMSMSVELEQIPAIYRPHLEDWIALALSKPAPLAAEASR